MRILITGGAGFIGSELVSRLCKRGHSVTVVDALTYAGKRENLADSRAELVVERIESRDAMRSVMERVRPEAVFNLAAESHVDRSIETPDPFLTTNVVGTYVLLTESYRWWKSLSADAAASFRYVQVSTDEVFGALGATGAFDENSPYAPNSPYSASKAGADHWVRAWHQTYGFPAITTHCSNNYGPRQYREKLIPRALRCALEGQRIPMYGDGLQIRDWIHVSDHCAGLELALERGSPGATYLFGAGQEVTNKDLLHRLCATLDTQRPSPQGPYARLIQSVEDRLGHDRRYAVDYSKAARELGYSPKILLDQGLPVTVAWYLA